MFSRPRIRAPQSPGSGHDLSELERFLCGDVSATPPLSLVQALNLSGWAYMATPDGHPIKVACKSSYYAARVRHEQIKAEVLTMVRAWNAAGIEPLIYKGFALAEFAYAKPGARFHGDVDVLVRPEHLEKAIAVGCMLGWERKGTPNHWLFNAHDPGEITLHHHSAATNFDIHQRLVPSFLPWSGRERALTESAWDNARRTEWHGTVIWLLAPEDAYIYGLAITRCWSDKWRLKSHDIIDAMVLKERGLTQDKILRRASGLGVGSTVSAFLRRCNAFVPCVSLRWPSTTTYLALEFMSAREHVPFEASIFAMRLLRTLVAAASVPKVLALWIAVRRALAGTSSFDHALDSLERSCVTQVGGLNGAMVWWLMARCRQLTTPVWPVMVYIESHRCGLKPRLCMGKFTDGIRGWVEVDGNPLPEFTCALGPLGGVEVIFERHARFT